LTINDGITSTSFQAICDDFADEISSGQQWTATVNTYQTLNSTLWVNDPYTTTPYTTAYEEATYLALQLLNPSPTCGYSGGNCVADISYAIWGIFYPSALNKLGPPTSPDYENAVWWESQAALYGASGNLKGFEILTPDPNVGPGNGGPQEFLVYNPSVSPTVVPTPEPPTSVLLGVGVLGLLVGVYRRGETGTSD
jgi:hypothetical protein